MLLQVILAGVLAVPFFMRRTIGDLWHRIRGKGEPQPSESSGEPDSRT